MQCEVWVVNRTVWSQALVFMRTAHELEAAVFDRRVVDREPDGASGKWAQRPIFAVLMSGRLFAVFCRFCKEAGIPQNDIGADDLLDHVQDVRVARIIQKR